jgi:hypothetical protein
VIKSRADAKFGFAEVGASLPPHYFIRNILAIRRCAEDPDVLPDWGKEARAAEGLAEFLTRCEQRLRMPEVAAKFPELPEALRGVAQLLREYETRQKGSWLARDTRKKRTRPQFLFMRWTSDDLKGICGTYLDNEVAVLTDIAFGGETTTDMVRAARRHGSES